MTTRLSLDLLRAAVGRLDRIAAPSEGASALTEAWEAAEGALQHLAGSSTLRGQELLRELRGRNVLSLAEAHAIVDLGGLAERVAAGHTPSPGELENARGMFATILGALDRRGTPMPAPTATPVGNTSPPPPPPLPEANTTRPNWLGRAVVAMVLLLVVGGGAWGIWALQREPGELRRGRAAYAAGDRLGARNAFAAVSGRYPGLAEPLIYLGRISREEGDLASAREHLRRAVALEPANPLGHRELAAVLLASGRPDLARSFYERAIRLDPADRTAQGYMGCTLMRLGQVPLAQRFLARAGDGPWMQCAAPVMVPAPPPPTP